ncbi:MAG: efflux RND transporter periplasmic adaptor subunit [Burkholderiaceae bacterium]|nr:efflux RND transporter periplasmic adaptor subunit [Burkholderiaceae bacterium]
MVKEPVPPQSSISGRRRWVAPAVGVLLVGAIAAGYAVQHGKVGGVASKTDTAEDKKQPVQELAASDYTTVQARELSVMLPISGALAPLNQATVKSKVIAEVSETRVPEGVKVARGQVVMLLGTGDLQAKVVAAQATEEDAKAKLGLALKTHENNQTLLRQKFISQTAYDTAENNVDIARAALKSATAQLEIARHALDDATIRAPIDGIVSKRFLQAGEKASPDTALFSIVDLRQMLLEAQVPASEIPRVKEGQVVAFDVEGFDSRRFHGKVARINPAADAGSRAITVYIAVDNPDGALRGGMFANGGITLQQSAATPVVPLAAVHIDNGAASVFKIENGKVVEQPVKLGLKNEDEGMVSVLSGLTAGTRIIAIKHLDGIKPGTAVSLPQGANDKVQPDTKVATAQKA